MSHAAILDAWLKEFEEAMGLADDVAARIRERDSIIASGGDPSRLVSSTRRKITVLGSSLDRLESLLQNPPAKPTLHEKELYRRQDMLLGIRYKTKQMAASLSTSQPQNRTVLGQDDGKKVIDTHRPTSILDNYGLAGSQTQIMREQQDSLANLGETANSTKHIGLAVNEEVDLQTRLLDDLHQDVGATSSHLKTVKRKLSGLTREASRTCSLSLVCLLLLGILVLILFICTLIKIL
eukprot:c23283_g1_i1 orf=402-1112(+)